MTIRSTILDAVVPITKWIGRTHVPYSVKKMRAKDYREIVEVASPGMILLSKIDGQMTNLFIPGEYKHGAVYRDEFTVVEAISKGVVQTDIIDFLLTKDKVCLLEPMFADRDQMEQVADWCDLQLGFPYDYKFGGDVKAFYCFELAYAAYKEICPGSPWELRNTLGEPTVTGDDYLNASSKWRIVGQWPK